MADTVSDKMERCFGKMSSLLNDVNRFQKIHIAKNYMRSEEAWKYLNVCKRTWQTYRNRKYFKFYKIGHLIYVKKEDLDEFKKSEHYLKQLTKKIHTKKKNKE